MTFEPGNHHQFLKLEKKQAKNGGKKSFTSPAKATAFGVSSRQRFWARHPNRNELSNRTCSSFAEAKAVPVMLYICSLINVAYIFLAGKRIGETDSSMLSIWQTISFMLRVGSAQYICELYIAKYIHISRHIMFPLFCRLPAKHRHYQKL